MSQLDGILRIGDTVLWRGCFGTESEQPVKVKRMEVTATPRTKYGDEVESVAWSVVRENRVILDLDNGHWCYAEQIAPYEEKQTIELTGG